MSHLDHGPDVGQPNGLAALGPDGKVPVVQLPTGLPPDLSKILISRVTGNLIVSRLDASIMSGV